MVVVKSIFLGCFSLKYSFHSKILIFFFKSFQRLKARPPESKWRVKLFVPKSTRKIPNSRGTRKHVFFKVIYGMNALIIGVILDKMFAHTNARLSFIFWEESILLDPGLLYMNLTYRLPRSPLESSLCLLGKAGLSRAWGSLARRDATQARKTRLPHSDGPRTSW